MNELALLAERVGADIESRFARALGRIRIGYQFPVSGHRLWWVMLSERCANLCSAPLRRRHELETARCGRACELCAKHVITEKIVRRFGESLAGQTIALWGLAFPNQHRRHARSAESGVD